MKTCPSCGYAPVPRNKRTLQRLYSQHFGGIPVMEMITRQWIRPFRVDDIDQIKIELLRFYEMDELTLDAYISGDDSVLPVWLKSARICVTNLNQREFEQGVL